MHMKKQKTKSGQINIISMIIILTTQVKAKSKTQVRKKYINLYWIELTSNKLESAIVIIKYD
jgi:hypothetical protein